MALHDSDQLTGFDSVLCCMAGVDSVEWLWRVCCTAGFSKQCGKSRIQSESGIFGHSCLDVFKRVVVVSLGSTVI